jgi:hypothetical protein
LFSIDAWDRDHRQEAEGDQQRQDDQDPAPDIRRAERVQQRFERGI